MYNYIKVPRVIASVYEHTILNFLDKHVFMDEHLLTILWSQYALKCPQTRIYQHPWSHRIIPGVHKLESEDIFVIRAITTFTNEFFEKHDLHNDLRYLVSRGPSSPTPIESPP